MSTYAIAVGVDPDNLRVAETPDNFGAFKTKEEAAQRLIAMVDGRMADLRKSKAHARRILKRAKVAS